MSQRSSMHETMSSHEEGDALMDSLALGVMEVEEPYQLTVPRTLAIRMITSGACRAMAILEMSGSLPPDGSQALKDAAELFRDGSRGLDTDGGTSSLADSARQTGVVSIVARAFRPDALEDLKDQLDELASDLDQIADGHPPSDARIKQIDSMLLSIRRSVAAQRARTTDRILDFEFGTRTG